MIRWCDNGHDPIRVMSGQRCRACSKRRESTRATPAARGYGVAHRNVRASLASMLPAVCGDDMGAPYCGQLIHQGETWVAAHRVDGQPEYGYVHAHPACNERAKARGGASGTGVGVSTVPAPSRLAFRTGPRFGADS